ncbi:hypothetical protein PCANC_05289 [Puccinia coronata f. sp. avenae]|uniref:Uncharacterized protein n=1 Tax=Puccinia coronata f. sp. avenae TaxID=200324 RepID=A0A2N5VYR0_9BASI|nr:hypothetical protein PCANC_05289 [Puccinia coronata f. sp. avenae]
MAKAVGHPQSKGTYLIGQPQGEGQLDGLKGKGNRPAFLKEKGNWTTFLKGKCNWATFLIKGKANCPTSKGKEIGKPQRTRQLANLTKSKAIEKNFKDKCKCKTLKTKAIGKPSRQRGNWTTLKTKAIAKPSRQRRLLNLKDNGNWTTFKPKAIDQPQRLGNLRGKGNRPFSKAKTVVSDEVKQPGLTSCETRRTESLRALVGPARPGSSDNLRS